jgi:hypothetical protein
VQVVVVSPTPLAVLLLWSDATGQVPVRTLPVVTHEDSAGGQARDPGLCLHERGPDPSWLLHLALPGGA